MDRPDEGQPDEGPPTACTKAGDSPTTLPRNNKEYGTKNYWENRFRAEESFEWLLSYQQLAPQLEPLLSTHIGSGGGEKSRVRILIVGCGNAPFSADLHDAGYTNIVNIDYSTAVITAMQKRHAARRSTMQWRVVDMTAMDEFPNEIFDVIIDKAAMDALMTHEGDVWNPSASVVAASYAMCEHMARMLCQGGTFVQISLAQPHFRKKYLLGWHTVNYETLDVSDDTYSSKFGWTFRSEAAGSWDEAGGFGHYLYIMTKQTRRNNENDDA